MKLIGQFDSSFVRRVGITMRLYEIPFEHLPWSVFGDADKLAAHNPLRRVPTLVLEDGTALVESLAILDEIDRRVDDARVLLPRSGPQRTRGLQIMGLATGFADKGVSLFYETLMHASPSAAWIERCTTQMLETLALLERERPATPYWLGDTFAQPDITVACVWRHMSEAHPSLIDPARYPRLAADSARCEALPVFREISQPFIVVYDKDKQ